MHAASYEFEECTIIVFLRLQLRQDVDIVVIPWPGVLVPTGNDGFQLLDQYRRHIIGKDADTPILHDDLHIYMVSWT